MPTHNAAIRIEMSDDVMRAQKGGRTKVLVLAIITALIGGFVGFEAGEALLGIQPVEAVQHLRVAQPGHLAVGGDIASATAGDDADVAARQPRLGERLARRHIRELGRPSHEARMLLVDQELAPI